MSALGRRPVSRDPPEKQPNPTKSSRVRTKPNGLYQYAQEIHSQLTNTLPPPILGTFHSFHPHRHYFLFIYTIIIMKIGFFFQINSFNFIEKRYSITLLVTPLETAICEFIFYSFTQ